MERTHGFGKGLAKLSGSVDLTQGSIIKGMVAFILPLLLGQLLQQFYNLADAWVVGNFADNDAFAAVSSAGSVVFLIVGFFNGIAIGGGVIISRYYGAKDHENVMRAVHTNFFFGVVASVVATVVGLLIVPYILRWMNTPDSVMPDALLYFRVYLGGVSTVILYNIAMAIMRSLGDSMHPLFYLMVSSLTNVALDLLFVAVFHWGVGGAAAATVASQALSCVLCIIKMLRSEGDMHLDVKKLRFYPGILGEVMGQGLPSGIQNSVISIGNIVVQANINAFGAFAMSGHGAYAKIESVVFLPITCISMSLPTFVSQNLGAKQYARARRGSIIFVIVGVVLAELIGVLLSVLAPDAIRLFIDEEEAISYGIVQIGITTPFYCLLSFSHCSAGVLRGCGKSMVPMVTMLSFWCAFRILYVTVATHFFPVYSTIAWAYPITWSLSSIVFAVSLWRLKWKGTDALEGQI